jgi:hypothetical protein
MPKRHSTEYERAYNRRPEVIARKKAWEQANRGKRDHTRHRQYRRWQNYRLRLEALTAYGSDPPCCMCECGCKENRVLLLDLDHVNNDGADHRRKLCNRRCEGNSFYRKLRKLGWPKDPPMRVLCVKCNVGRQRNGGQCVELGILPFGLRLKPGGRCPEISEQRGLFD